jgi:isopentenyl phosphate kinase
MEGLCKTRRSVQKLNAVTVDRLIYAGVNAIGISPGMTYSGLRAHGATTRYGNTNVNANANDDGRSGMRDLCEAIKAAIKAGLVPVVHGDACLLHDGMHGGILGGDTLAEGLVAMWNTDDDDGIAITIAADAAPRDDRGTIMDRTGRIYRGRDDDAITRVIFITDVGGVYTSDPKIDEGAELIRLILVDGDTGELSISKCDDGNDIGATPGGGRSLVSDDNDMLVTGSCHEHDVTGGLKVCSSIQS